MQRHCSSIVLGLATLLVMVTTFGSLSHAEQPQEEGQHESESCYHVDWCGIQQLHACISITDSLYAQLQTSLEVLVLGIVHIVHAMSMCLDRLTLRSVQYAHAS